VRVKFFAYIRDYTGCKEAEVSPRETVGALVQDLCETYGQRFREKVLDTGGEEFSKDIIIMINGRHVFHLGGFQAPLKPEDTVQIFPMVAGG